MMRRQMKLAAVLVVVVLALTGFTTSTSGGKGSKSKGSSSGGGCSNSKKSNSGYRHTDYDDDDYDDNSSGSSGSSYGTPTPTASDGPAVRVIRCAQPRKGKRKAVTASVVELRSKDTGSHTYEVDVTFYDARGNTVDTAETTTTLDAGDVRNLTVRMESPRRVSEVKRCEVTAQLL
ncbi:FxLYD domain-containing protein [Streptomyces microflavus]|uniref:FxLYD domain-containing protein n=1 Tax=Streptomyces microflavus TaxID=1919 RepID=UPI002DD90F2F|nr:FxLYD domain-containing protein [Streptomyces microflavus]WSA62536.1 FxLYD domain-containing protein [Streptomyces microflavus]WSS34779.1 FxLYD domain-containing protein [Streptomyces microflavus]WST16654.1 FxLYD domain-containing protein [Streptomyces microflavus]